LVIDDDKDLREALKAHLEHKNHRVVLASGGADGLREAFRARPDLVILGVMMPMMDGWEVCQRLRQLSNMPIIMLTARTSELDTIKGLSTGADDYVTKPFSASELEARIQAVLRRSLHRTGKGNLQRSFYTNGNVSIDFERRVVTVDGRQVNLSPIEFKLLTTFARNEGRVLPHRYLLTEVWGAEYADQVDYIKLYVQYLRSRIEKNPADPVHIQTEWGVGYLFI
jgi:two-component system KDP operon response regulator KdpE